MARINFNPEQTRPFSGSSPVFPSGDYVVEITNEEERDFQSGAGKGLSLDYRIVDGEFKGMIVRDFLNLWHTSPKATEIAQRRLVAIAHAVGVRNFIDTRELHHKRFVVRLSKVVYNGQDRNQVDAYLPAQQQQQQQQQTNDPATEYANAYAIGQGHVQPPTAPSQPATAPTQSQPYWS